MTEIIDNRSKRAVHEGRIDRVARLDRQQNADDGIRCPINPEHGRMGVHYSGESLLCTAIITRPTSNNQNLKLCTGHKVLSMGE